MSETTYIDYAAWKQAVMATFGYDDDRYCKMSTITGQHVTTTYHLHHGAGLDRVCAHWNGTRGTVPYIRRR